MLFMVWVLGKKGEIKGTKAMKEAYGMGKNV